MALNFTYLNDQVLECLLVLRCFLIKLLRKAIKSHPLQTIDTSRSLLHLLQSRLIVTPSHHLSMLDLHVFHLLLMALFQLGELFLVNALRLMLSVPLPLHHDLKGLLVRILPHHSLQLEGVPI